MCTNQRTQEGRIDRTVAPMYLIALSNIIIIETQNLHRYYYKHFMLTRLI